MTADFSRNLRSICAEHGSIARVCREIGINRQQFNRYLNGTGLPSAHNMRRIARHFDLTEADLFSSHEEFNLRCLIGRPKQSSGPADLMTAAFRDQAATLRPYLGFYHAHFWTPTWDGMILKSLVWLREIDGFVTTRSLERIKSTEASHSQKSRYEGLVTRRGNRIYIVEHEMMREGSIVETILTPSYRQEVKYLRGTTMGIAWQPHIMPYASRSIWKRVEDKVSIRDAVRACGAFAPNSRQIEPAIRAFLTENQALANTANGMNLLV
ncbi:helix-turn-helix transcriptional regulator [Roseibium album]|uniref:Helix-turn-helix domain protein n=1 Tax=Roseibium album TaxID=311410 RepID=A0A0M6Z5S6_9HYPH|nr:helix-turn-helix transcriptional regulator [Roseibium album]MBG6144298.1 transcriptional regulator with XRE-family HTH domain [Labrenzia sp. EL_142]MBG6166738.1 transcriptional regulator with XRE-family HTH domain [Labrenzia sp. EL_195]MBG6201802.1 transcriptional regulator with XRE-family HTH domain [Labrenzia sp. EL_13]MBG6207802.1 transcriptional regulator with XRE-family HTH domain [Labrenzia sp. EL_126]CTQ58118.1 Helix-turn-helix domain protein [Roseibium album]